MRRWIPPILIIVAGLVLIYAVLVRAGFLRERFLSEPFGYGADAAAVYGWNGVEYVYNDYKSRTGAPLQIPGRPALDRVGCILFKPDCALIWIMGRATGSIVSGVNIYFYLTYALCFLFALFGLRFFGASWPASAVMAALYALLPYHQMRSINHLPEISYFIVPAYAAILYLIYRGARAPASERSETPFFRDRLAGWRWAFPAALLFVFFPASMQKYYQFFFALFAFCAGVLGGLDARKARPVWMGLLFAAVACAGLAVRGKIDSAAWGDPQHIVHTTHQLTTYGEDELYPLKLVQMILPIPGHRIRALADMRAGYDSGHPMVNYETTTVSLGLIGTLGLLGLIWLFITASSRSQPLTRLVARLTLFGILLGAMGGLGSMISDLSWATLGPKFPLSQARGWDRVVVFIAFFALLASAWGMDRLVGWFTRRGKLPAVPAGALAWCCALGIFAVGVYDQVRSAPPNVYSSDDAIYRSDRRFFAAIDSLHHGTYQVFQWPVMFPWGGSYNGVYYTDGYRPLLNSRRMDLSFGGDPDSRQGEWLSSLSSMPPPRIFDQLCAAGFEGVVVHSAAVSPAQQSLVAVLARKVKPMDSGDGLLYFDIRRACGVPPSVAAECLARLRARLLADEDRKRWIGGEQFAGTIGTTEPTACGGQQRASAAGQAGWLTLGPYIPLKPGKYTARFEFAKSAKPSELVIDWHDGKQANPITAFQPRSAASDFKLTFIVPRPSIRLVEFRVRVEGDSAVVFRGVQLDRH